MPKKFFLALFLAYQLINLSTYQHLYSQEEDIHYLEDEKAYFITLTRKLEPIYKLPANISVIDSEKIGKSNAQTTVELLKQETGIVIRDLYGFGIKAEVDMRGFGESGASNVLVLIDGRRVNQIDLSNVDWSQIPLDQVERIEIIHGPGGAVLYGDNAVGGAINIITKKIKEGQKLELGGHLGSYLTNNLLFGLQRETNKFNYSIRLSQFQTKGYRQNGNFSTRDFGLQAELKSSPNSLIAFRGNYHLDNSGLPGYITEDDWKNDNLTITHAPEDNVKSEDIYGNLLLKSESGRIGILESELSWRKRRADTYWISSLWSDKRDIHTFGLSQRLFREDSLLGKKNHFTTGIEFYRNNQDIKDQFKKTTIARNSLALYFDNRFSLSEILLVELGLRGEDTAYNYEDSNLNKDRSEHRSSALRLGLGLFYSEHSNLFLNLGTSFRLPKTDEYYKFDPLTFAVTGWNKNLKPQESLSIDLSAKHFFSKTFSLNATVYRKDVRNEIYYDPYTMSNGNYEKTIHQGVETEAVFAPLGNFSVALNYSFVDAKFAGCIFAGKKIPAVPKHKGTISTNLNFSKNFIFTLSDTYVGSQWFISDQNNSTDKLRSYNVVDAKITFRNKGLRVFAGVKNLTNTKYAEYAVLSGWAGKVYYPAVKRNFVTGLSFSF